MNPHVFALDILITEMADFTDPEAGGIHESDHGFYLEIRQCRNKNPHIILRRDKRQVSVKFPHGYLCRIPWTMQDIEGEETDLSNGGIDRSVR